VARSSAQTRQRILDAAFGLFWRQGFLRVSLDEVATRAKITKRALYQHFRSKDDLMAAVLDHASRLSMERLGVVAARMPRSASGAIDAFFGELAAWGNAKRYSGAGFTRAVAELADLPGHPARAIARRHKALVEAVLTDLLAKRAVLSLAERAREMMLLMEGAMSLILIHGDPSYAQAAARAAKTCIAKASKRPSS
jgi:AcrR family transcriptional regulator